MDNHRKKTIRKDPGEVLLVSKARASLRAVDLTFSSREHTLPPVFDLLNAYLLVILIKENEGRERLTTVPSF